MGESHGPSQGKCASVESLLDQPDPPSFFRSRSTSTPHAFEAHDYGNEELPVNPMETCSAQKDVSVVVDPVHVGQQQVRVVAQRGKSMEELGASKITRLSAMSKSSEQLDQLRRRSGGPGTAERDKRSVSFIAEVREAQGQERARRTQHGREDMGNEPEVVGQKNSQGQTQNQTHKKPLLKQNSEPGEIVTEGTRSSSRSTSPASSSSCSSRARLQSGSPGSHGPVTDELGSNRQTSQPSSNPTSPRGVESSEREVKLSSPTQTKPPGENRSCLRVRASPPVPGPEREQSVDEPSSDVLTPDLNQEVSLSRGVTTDPSLWILPPEEEIKEDVQNPPLTDGGSDDQSTCSAPQTQTSETSVSPSTSVTESDITQQVEEEEKNLHAEDEKQEMEERGAPEGETETEEGPADRPEWEGLVKAVVQADQSLARVFYPLANRKTALMLMEQLLSEDTLLMEEHYKKKQEQSGAAESAEPDKAAEASPCVPAADDLEPQSSELQSTTDVTEKKRLLVSYIEERLHSLEETRGTLQTEIKENVAAGRRWRSWSVSAVCPWSWRGTTCS
ncbi:hypothetical protein INR49_022527 [Caranx melampygus]|nr:hypothetical protein INR49_022527 [Caranx melampygus]